MTDRERWIVYPLLALALGLTLRDKITGTLERLVVLKGRGAAIDFDRGVLRTRVIDADVLRCQSVEVRSQVNRPLVRLHAMEVPGGEGTTSKSGAITVYGQDGKEIIVLRANHALRGEFVEQKKEGEPVKLVFKVEEVKEEGGMLEIYNGEKTLSLVLAHHLLESGLYAKNPKRQLARLSRVIERPPPAEKEEGKRTKDEG